MINVYIGLPGSGKSTHAAKMCRKWIKKGETVYSNFPVKGAYLIDETDVGVYDISNGILLWDEAGISLSNRNYKDMSKSLHRWLKLYRHYKIKVIYVYSQAFDFDATLRRLADHMFIIDRSILPDVSFTKRLSPHWAIDDSTGDPHIVWKFVPLSKRFFYRRLYYRDFDSFDAPTLPAKEFRKVVVAADETQSVAATDSTDNN